MFVLWTLALLAALFVVQWLKWKHESITITPNFYRLKKTLGGLNEFCLLVHYLSLFFQSVVECCEASAVTVIDKKWPMYSLRFWASCDRQPIFMILNVMWVPKISGWWFGTMEFYDFPFSWECHVIPTDEVHHFIPPMVPCRFSRWPVPSGKHTKNYWKLVDLPWFTHWKWWLSIVFGMFTRPGKYSVPAGWIPWIPASWTKTSRCKP